MSDSIPTTQFSTESEYSNAPTPHQFRTTQWSMVLQAANVDEEQSRRALDRLCKISWPPIFAFVRRLGYSNEDAQDLAQGFFQHVLTNNVLSYADKERGRFRSFLLASLKNFVSNETRKLRAEKRGGNVQFVSLDQDESDGYTPPQIASNEQFDQGFDRAWAEEIIRRTLDTLKNDYEKSGKLSLFEKLSPYLQLSSTQESYQEIAESLNMSTGTIAVAVFRLRKRYGELLRNEIAQTVSSPMEIESEIRFLLEALTN